MIDGGNLHSSLSQHTLCHTVAHVRYLFGAAGRAAGNQATRGMVLWVINLARWTLYRRDAQVVSGLQV